jgi:hypothetical protein
VEGGTGVPGWERFVFDFDLKDLVIGWVFSWAGFET